MEAEEEAGGEEADESGMRPDGWRPFWRCRTRRAEVEVLMPSWPNLVQCVKLFFNEGRRYYEKYIKSMIQAQESVVWFSYHLKDAACFCLLDTFIFMNCTHRLGQSFVG